MVDFVTNKYKFLFVPRKKKRLFCFVELTFLLERNYVQVSANMSWLQESIHRV